MLRCLNYVAVAGIVLGTVGEAKSGPIQWSIADGGNGHYFELILPSTPAQNYTWTEARDAAASMVFDGSRGHLATVTSAAENAFLQQHFSGQLFDNLGVSSTYAWIGLYAPTPTSGFQWVTGQPFAYSNWGPGEPNFYGTPLWQYVHYWTRDFGGGPSWTWNNEQNGGYQPQRNRYGYIAEFDGPFTTQARFLPVFNTGVDNNGQSLPGLSTDPHFRVLETNSPAIVSSSLWPDWVPDSSNSAWIGRSSVPFPGNYGYYTYETTFDLTGYDRSTAVLSGRWAADNSGVIRLNGQDTGVSVPFLPYNWDKSLYPDLTSFTISGGFKPGLNKLDFVVYEPDGYDGLRLAGLTLEALPLSAVPEPPGLALAAVGTLALAGRGWRRRRPNRVEEPKE